LSRPLVSVVTPFHNTASFLAQCIESVLNQSYSRFEYVLVDNCSSDGSSEIAKKYANRDSRIRLVQRSELIPQVRNYNSALEEISGESLYCKIVQADDYIFPECLQRMVEAFEQSERIGLVSSYYLKGDQIYGSGFPAQRTTLSGQEMARLYFSTGIFVFGSPTSVMFRSSLVRDSQPFYEEHLLHEDTEKCIQILKNWDFGFVHQVLSFLRTDNQSISSGVRNFQPNELDRFILVQKYAHLFLDSEESEDLKRRTKQEYYRALAHAALRFRGDAFWRYHKEGLKTANATLDRACLFRHAALQLLWMAVNPGATVSSAFKFSKRRTTTNNKGTDSR
jgi:glycosyltransferase involved in cell wall biosynthesis